MPRKKTATLRELRTAEAWLAFHKERERVLMNGMEHVRAVLNSGADAATVVENVRQAIAEADMNLNVSRRMHEMRIKEVRDTPKFPDES